MTTPETQSTKTNIKDRILEEIRCGDVSMRPKLFFTLKVAVLGVLTFGMLLASILIINFIIFGVRTDSHHMLLGFGSRGLQSFLYFFPWTLLVVDLVLVVILVKLLCRFRFVYKRPVIYSLVGLLSVIVVLGFTLDRETQFNYQLAARTHSWPEPINTFRRIVRQPPLLGNGICLCTIVAINGNILEVADARSGTTTLTIVLPLNNPYATTSNLQLGDLVYIAGEEDEDGIEAFGVQLMSR